MVVDASALLSILLIEPDHEAMRQAIERAPRPIISSVNILEVRVTMHRRKGPGTVVEVERLVAARPITVVTFDANQSLVAFDAYQRFGKGSGHPARLNLGDCAAYALAVTRGEPLLYKGGDFALTDVTPAL